MLGVSLFFLFMLVVGIHWGIPKAQGRGFVLTSPAFYPYLVCGFGLLVSALGTLAAALGKRAADAQLEPTYRIGKALVRFLLVLMVFVLNYILFQRLGALATSVLVFAGLLILGGERHIPVIVVASIGVPVIAYFVFSYLARVPLPTGVLSF